MQGAFESDVEVGILWRNSFYHQLLQQRHTTGKRCDPQLYWLMARRAVLLRLLQQRARLYRLSICVLAILYNDDFSLWYVARSDGLIRLWCFLKTINSQSRWGTHRVDRDEPSQTRACSRTPSVLLTNASIRAIVFHLQYHCDCQSP